MRTLGICLIASMALAPFVAFGQSTDAQYCQALVKAYTGGGNARGSLQPDNAIAVAIAQCQEGKPAPAIPVLEQALKDAKVTLPPRN